MDAFDLGMNLPNLGGYEPDVPSSHMWADEQFEILKSYIQNFEKTLDESHEVGIMMTNFGQSVVMQVNEITYEYPVIMVFKGYVGGREAILIQHINQLNFMLTSVEISPEIPKKQIGFIDNSVKEKALE